MNLLMESLNNFSKSAKRVETLPIYKLIGDEWEEYQDYINGIPRYEFKPNNYFKTVQEQIKKGKTQQRIRVLPKILNSYIRFEFETGYVINSIAGEEILTLKEQQYEKIVNKYNLGDFWIFDDKYVLQMKYGIDGEFIESKLINEQDKVNNYIKFFDELKEKSENFKNVLKLIRNTEVEY